VRGADEPVCGTAHLTLPTLRVGPLPLPLKGGEGLVSAGIILVERDASRAIKFSSPDSHARRGRGGTKPPRVRAERGPRTGSGLGG
jgi:hypothetical protein